MRYLRIFAGGDGRSGFEDVQVAGVAAVTVAGVPPLLVSGPFSVGGMTFVEQPEDAAEWEPHVAPRCQWVIVLRGRAAVTVSTGERREGHVSTPLTQDLAFAMIPTA